ncbi:MAG: 2'-5' RNA ligase family protein [Alphaproteobacteria bacterium]|nr:MAG: 2'-5' RNA ligase family protein [Alphaproteobacteria bacterium]
MLQNNMYPHITLAIYQEECPDQLPELLLQISNMISSFKLVFSSVGVFPGDHGALFLAPVRTKPLMQLRETFHQLTADFEEQCAFWYLPNNWVPHCTLAQFISTADSARVLSSVPALSTEWSPIPATCTAIELVEFYPAKQLATYDLTGQKA